MINFDIEKKGYNKEQVSEYFEQVKAEYEELYSENQTLRLQLQEVQEQLALEQANVVRVSAQNTEAVARALIDAEAEAQRIIDKAREQAWKIITDAKKGLPVFQRTEKPSLPVSAVKRPEPAAQPTVQAVKKPPVSEVKRTRADIEALITSILGKR